MRLGARASLLFCDDKQQGVDDEEDQHAKAKALAFVEFRLGGPYRESDSILGVSRNRLGRDKTVAGGFGVVILVPGIKAVQVGSLSSEMALNNKRCDRRLALGIG